MSRDRIVAVWRVLVIWTFAFWQGGFLFYASAVVPTAQQVIGHRQQGFITRHVATWLNGAGAVSLCVLLVDLGISRDPRQGRRRLLFGTWLAMAACQGILFAMHPRMDALLDAETRGVESGFHMLHRTYLWVHTVQWGFSVAWTLLQVSAWRARDAATSSKPNVVEGPS